MADFEVHDALADDFAAIATIAEAGDSHADEPYLTFVQSIGALRVAVDAGTIVGFGGVITVGDGTTMITDLFVAPTARGRSIGGTLLANLLDGAGQRMTFSSQHAAALPAYSRAGMVPSWRLLYLRGTIGENNASPTNAFDDQEARAATPWRVGRPDLAAYYESRGGIVGDNFALLQRGGETFIARLQDHRGASAFEALLTTLPSNSTVTCCSPENSPVAARALARGFEVVDNDIFCHSPGVVLADELQCLDPGLC